MSEMTIKYVFDPEIEQILRENNDMLHELTDSGNEKLARKYVPKKTYAKTMEMSEKTVGRRIKDGTIKAVKIGRKIFIDTSINPSS